MFCRHEWGLLFWTQIHVWDFEKDGPPNRIDTQLNGLCSKCGKVKKKRIRGQLDPEAATACLDAWGWEHGELTNAD